MPQVRLVLTAEQIAQYRALGQNARISYGSQQGIALEVPVVEAASAHSVRVDFPHNPVMGNSVEVIDSRAVPPPSPPTPEPDSDIVFGGSGFSTLPEHRLLFTSGATWTPRIDSISQVYTALYGDTTETASSIPAGLEAIIQAAENSNMFEIGTRWVVTHLEILNENGDNPSRLGQLSANTIGNLYEVVAEVTAASYEMIELNNVYNSNQRRITLYKKTAWKNLRAAPIEYPIGSNWLVVGIGSILGNDCMGAPARVEITGPLTSVINVNSHGCYEVPNKELHNVLAPTDYTIGSNYLVRWTNSIDFTGANVGIHESLTGTRVTVTGIDYSLNVHAEHGERDWSFGLANLHECLIPIPNVLAAQSAATPVPFNPAEIETAFPVGSNWKLISYMMSDTSLPREWVGKEVRVVDHRILRSEIRGDKYRRLVIRLVGMNKTQEIYYGHARNMLKSTSEIDQMASKARNLMKDLAETETLRKAMNLIRCGLEFEFHSLNGLTASEQNQFDPRGTVNEARLIIDVAEAMREHGMGLAYVAEWGYISAARNKQLAELAAAGATEINELNVPDEKKRTKLLAHLEACIAKRHGYIRTYLLDNGRERYLIRSPSYKDILGAQWKEVEGYTEIGSDASVRGGEIRTKGGRKITEFLKVAKVLATNKFEVDEGCSFHIHLSVPGVQHSYGRRFQAEMYAYLLKHYNQMPEGMRSRIKSDKGAKRWAKFDLENGDKYVAIFKHESGTWEFRLFGNVKEFKEMYQCLSLAVGALRHAYRVKFKLTPSLLRNAPLSVVADALAKSKNAPETFFTTLADLLNATEEIELSAA